MENERERETESNRSFMCVTLAKKRERGAFSGRKTEKLSDVECHGPAGRN